MSGSGTGTRPARAWSAMAHLRLCTEVAARVLPATSVHRAPQLTGTLADFELIWNEPEDPDFAPDELPEEPDLALTEEEWLAFFAAPEYPVRPFAAPSFAPSTPQKCSPPPVRVSEPGAGPGTTRTAT